MIWELKRVSIMLKLRDFNVNYKNFRRGYGGDPPHPQHPLKSLSENPGSASDDDSDYASTENEIHADTAAFGGRLQRRQ